MVVEAMWFGCEGYVVWLRSLCVGELKNNTNLSTDRTSLLGLSLQQGIACVVSVSSTHAIPCIWLPCTDTLHVNKEIRSGILETSVSDPCTGPMWSPNRK